MSLKEARDFRFTITAEGEVEPEDHDSSTDPQKILARVGEIINDDYSDWLATDQDSDSESPRVRLNRELDEIEKAIDGWVPGQGATITALDESALWTIEITRVS